MSSSYFLFYLRNKPPRSVISKVPYVIRSYYELKKVHNKSYICNCAFVVHKHNALRNLFEIEQCSIYNRFSGTCLCCDSWTTSIVYKQTNSGASCGRPPRQKCYLLLTHEGLYTRTGDPRKYIQYYFRYPSKSDFVFIALVSVEQLISVKNASSAPLREENLIVLLCFFF